jgi:NAD(P)-dependent dehydrogenase (short-subunit alcohol dehydrogenase family)
VVFADMNEDTAKESSELSKKHASSSEYHTTTFKMDVSDAASVQAMVDFVVAKFGRLDYAVNAAGVSLAQPCAN